MDTLTGATYVARVHSTGQRGDADRAQPAHRGGNHGYRSDAAFQWDDAGLGAATPALPGAGALASVALGPRNTNHPTIH